jgi:starch phosphorylase
MTQPTRFTIEVQPNIPFELHRLEDLANNLIYSSDRQVRGLFFRLDRTLWDKCGHNPKIFLRRVDQRKLEEAADDQVYMQDYIKVISSYDAYLHKLMKKELSQHLNQNEDLISYSCAEFGLHESFPIYSGGLGILAGDHCKAASDLGLPFVAIGILYRQGYFNQQIDASGHQVAQYNPSNFHDLPIQAATDEDGNPLSFAIELPDRSIHLQIWVAQVGHIPLYLLDSDMAQNSEEDRRITYQLYGGDRTNRLLQEIVLGIGGVRAQRLLGINPTVWHVNEGHAVFQIIERCRELVASGMPFNAALEAVAADTVFTTHTPVPAGHDIFDHALMEHYFSGLVKELNISMQEFLALGSSPANSQGFNMTALALRGSRRHNGVSAIHGEVASEMEQYIWPEISPEENPISSITNGVHVPTFLANEWANLFDIHFGGGWRNQLLSPEYWPCIKEIPHHSYWSVRQTLKTKMLEAVKERYIQQNRRNGISESQIQRITKYLDPSKTDVLTIGFARRFATYKRATLVFSDIERLEKLINNESRPVVLIFAGKAHPHDLPGQELLRAVHEISQKPAFEGKVILLEDFDMALGRKLVSGVDVWLNTPVHPLEASGTSGQKAAINGVLNLSVLDGWWAEGFNGKNGWGIAPHNATFSEEFRDREEANELLDILENQVIPLYYQKDGHGMSDEWIEKCQNTMETLIPEFNSERMVMDYIEKQYAPAARHGKKYRADKYAIATQMADWKHKVLAAWPQVSLKLIEKPKDRILREDTFNLKIEVDLAGLAPEDIAAECLIGRENAIGEFKSHTCASLHFVHQADNGNSIFELSMILASPGNQCYQVRIFPFHELLSHKMEMGCMRWL